MFTLLSFWMIDRFKRKPLYIVDSLGMAVALVLRAVTVTLGRFQGDRASGAVWRRAGVGGESLDQASGADSLVCAA